MKRCKEEILRQILEVCSEEPVSRTKIVHQANLNFKTVNPYLERLINAGLLEVSEGPVMLYKITSKGRRVLKHMKTVQSMINPATKTTD